jgi:hypothetical protein
VNIIQKILWRLREKQKNGCEVVVTNLSDRPQEVRIKYSDKEKITKLEKGVCFSIMLLA